MKSFIIHAWSKNQFYSHSGFLWLLNSGFFWEKAVPWDFLESSVWWGEIIYTEELCSPSHLLAGAWFHLPDGFVPLGF